MFKRILALALTAGLATGAAFINFSKIQIGQVPKPVEVAVAAKQANLICPGPVYVNGGETGLKLGKFTQSGVAAVLGWDSGNQISINANAFQNILGKTSATEDFNAIQIQNSKQKLAGGLAAANCSPGVSEAWFIAGDNSVGREALLVLVNPTLVDATVSLNLIGTEGTIQGTGLSGISAPAGKVTVLPMAAFAPKSATFAVQVSSRGAALGMWLQQKTIRGLTPGGLDLVSAAGLPGKTIDIPGLFVRTTTKLEALTKADPDYQDTKPVLRVAALGDRETTFTAQVQGADGKSFGTVIQGTVAAGAVGDFELDGLTDGDYIVHVDANQPILGSVRFSRLGSGEPDFAWATSVTPTKLQTGFTAPVGAISKLSLANATDDAVTATLSGKKIEVPANSNLVIPLTAGLSYRLSTTGLVSASQVIDVAGNVAVLPILDYRSETGKIKVLVR